VTEVERFFRRLVSTLAASDPARLEGPVPLDDITGSVLPYRTHRRVLELDTVEDYEAVLLRLCAGESDLVWTEPEDARKRFVQETRSNNPDLTVLYAFENVQLSFRPEPLLWALAPNPRAEYQPPEEPVEPPSVPGPESEPTVSEPQATPVPTCRHCGESLPTNRAVNFCPHCGESQTRILCPECRSEVEPGWRHCVNCGALVGEG
jgi:predicted RNA-binding Zn-ribbon protein involved in translation (DUF1610 family)